MQPFGHGPVVLLVMVLTKICSPSGCCNQQGYNHPQAARQLTEVFTLLNDGFAVFKWDNLSVKGAP
jgi:hypothetical protein